MHLRINFRPIDLPDDGHDDDNVYGDAFHQLNLALFFSAPQQFKTAFHILSLVYILVLDWTLTLKVFKVLFNEAKLASF